MLQLYVRLRRGNRANRLYRAGHAVVNLFDRTGMLDRHYPCRVPLNPNSWFLFAIRRQKRWFYRNIQPLAAALHMKNKLVVWMLADVFQQRDRIVDGRFIKPANDVS